MTDTAIFLILCVMPIVSGVFCFYLGYLLTKSSFLKGYEAGKQKIIVREMQNYQDQVRVIDGDALIDDSPVTVTPRPGR